MATILHSPCGVCGAEPTTAGAPVCWRNECPNKHYDKLAQNMSIEQAYALGRSEGFQAGYKRAVEDAARIVERTDVDTGHDAITDALCKRDMLIIRAIRALQPPREG